MWRDLGSLGLLTFCQVAKELVVCVKEVYQVRLTLGKRKELVQLQHVVFVHVGVVKGRGGEDVDLVRLQQVQLHHPIRALVQLGHIFLLKVTQEVQ